MSDLRQDDTYFHLCEAIDKGDKVTAHNLILNNAGVNTPKERANTLLHRAIIKFNDLDIIKMLLDRGADIHARDCDDNTPLDIAIQKNKTKAASLLIRKGALDGKDLNLLLNKAIHKNNHTIVKMIIKNNPLNNLFTSLPIAVSERNAMMIEAIIPHVGFSKRSDLYIPRDLVIECGRQSKECVELLLQWNFGIHPDSHHDEDFIYAAVENGHLPIVMQLLERGIDVNMVNSKTGLNLLMIACSNKHHKIVEELLQHKANVNVATSNNNMISNCDKRLCALNHPLSLANNNDDMSSVTCLHIAVFNSDPMTTKLLLRHGAKITDDPNFFLITCMAVLLNHEEIVRILLDHGVNVHDIDPQEATILYRCLNFDISPRYSMYHCFDSEFNEHDLRFNIAKLLLEKGAGIHLQTPGNDFIFGAVTKGHRKIAQLFLDYDADVQYVGPDGDTLLHVAIDQKSDIEFTEFIKRLLKLNFPVNIANRYGQTPLLIASKTKSKNQLKIIEALLDCNANVNCADNSSITPLHYASYAHNLELVKILLHKGANPNAMNRKGQTPLHVTCRYESDVTSNIIQLLLKHDANIEAMDKNGHTPLFRACAANNPAAVRCLLENRANVNHADKENLTPLLFAVQNLYNCSAVVKILLEHDADVHRTDMQGNSIIHLIVQDDDVELIKRFVHTDVDFSSVNKKGDSPLHIAVKKASVEMTECLIKCGGDIDILNKNNRTPLEVAIAGRPTKNQGPPSLNEPIVTILITQVIKSKVAGLKVNDKNLDIVYNFDYNIMNENNYSDREKMLSDIQQFEAECEQEIEKMKTESVSINNHTFYDLLKENTDLLGKFGDNKTIHQTLKQEIYDNKFPLYVDIVRSRFREAKLRH